MLEGKKHSGTHQSIVLAQKTDMKTNGSEDPDINPHSYNQLIFDKGAQST
jgi:hypothetical protein